MLALSHLALRCSRTLRSSRPEQGRGTDPGRSTRRTVPALRPEGRAAPRALLCRTPTQTITSTSTSHTGARLPLSLQHTAVHTSKAGAIRVLFFRVSSADLMAERLALL